MSRDLVTTGGFDVKPTNLGEAKELATLISGTNMVPKHYQGKEADCLVAMMMGSEIGMNPMQSLQNIAVINGKPSLYGDAMLAIVMAHPAFEKIDESYDEATKVATCKLWRKGGSTYNATFGDEEATQAGLLVKSGPWSQYPKRMKQMRARGFGLRSLFPDALAGLISAEEAQDMPIPDEEVKSEPIDMGEAQVTVVDLPDESFNKNLPKWTKAINEGIRTATEIIDNFEEKKNCTFSVEQKQTLGEIKANNETDA